ncbi:MULTISPECIES: DUF6264 family protein [unclassified Curtobacterium]|uniref:DUF6264 family protein n=1 Tax=unclassified Curtobacterium TaxID=257496 RepID=UPI00226B5370|nr:MULTISPECIES: DUF6264 family protein [unclassified Curtobacterium]
MSVQGDWSAAPDRDRGVPPQGTGSDTSTGTNSRPQGRPAPQYGEYAPEGWVNPVLVEQERLERQRAERERPEQQQQQQPAPRTVRAERPDTDAGRAPAAVGTPVAARFGASPADFLLTVMLLAFGLVSVLQSLAFRSVAANLGRQLELRYTALSDPGALVTAALVSAIGSLVLFVLVAWWSVVRLRNRKRTVWVPLLGGLVASVLTLSAFLTVMLHDDRFVAWAMQHAGG